MDELLVDGAAVPEAVDAETQELMSVLDPFQGDSQMVKWGQEINLGQLKDEVTAALGAVQMAVYPPEDEAGADLPVDADHPNLVFVSPSSVDLVALRRMLGAHRPDPHYGLTPEQIQQAQLHEKIRAKEPLTQDELLQAVQMLYGAV